MQHPHTGVIAGVAGLLFLSALAAAQSNAARSPWKYYPEDVRANVGDGGPAPKRDLTGTWAGPSSGAGVPEGERLAAPPFTPFTCIPSSVQRYLKEMGDPAGSDPDAAIRDRQRN